MKDFFLLLLECGGWDSNPRRTSPSGPKPDPFGHSGTPARLHIMKTVYNKNLIKKHQINNCKAKPLQPVIFISK